MRSRRLKLYGERNTGTRYLTRLLQHNLDCEVLRGVVPRWVTWLQAITPGREAFRDTYFERSFPRIFGWKHSQVDVDRLLALGPVIEDLHFLALVKNPYSWLLSLERRPYHRRSNVAAEDVGLEALLGRDWPTVRRENGPAAYRDAIDLWNRKGRAYLDLADRLPTTLLTYERLVAEPAQALEEIRRDSGGVWKRQGFENLPESTKEKGKDSSYYRDYYGNERWREKLTRQQIELVNARLDRDVVAQLGYGLL